MARFMKDSKILDDIEHLIKAGKVVKDQDFSKLDLGLIDLQNGKFTRCDFSFCYLVGANFGNCVFNSCDFTGADLTFCSMYKSHHARSKFNNANMEGMCLKKSTLIDPQISGIDLKFRSIDVRGVKLKQYFLPAVNQNLMKLIKAQQIH